MGEEASKDKSPVVGVGGIFIRANSAVKLSRWYRDHLGIEVSDNVALFTWLSPKKHRRPGQLVWAIFPRNSKYLGEGKRFMVNYRVKDLKKVLNRLRREGVSVDKKTEDSQYGKFGWVVDPEGNRIELWQPPPDYKASEKETKME